MIRYDVVIVGAGHAGAQTATTLRQTGFTGSIAMVGDEADPPYERPALSKEYLAGQRSLERLLLRPASFWSDRRIDMLLGRRVADVDARARRVVTEDGEAIGYGALVWATGGRPRRLTCPGHDLHGVHCIRNRSDVDRMVRELVVVERVVIVGGGFIGLEAAAVLAKLGRRVAVLEALPRVLARVACEPLSVFYEHEHRSHGVDVRLSVTVAGIEHDAGQVTGVRLSDGELLPAGMVIVGIGIVPAVEPLLKAGAEGTNGVRVDEFCRTSLPDVYAVGDCAEHRNAFADDAPIRLESVQNANDQATTAAKSIFGAPVPYRSVPWFWSNQYDLRLQTVGLSTGHDAVMVRGDVTSRAFSVVYLRNGRIIALDCVNATKDYVQGRRLVEARACVTLAALADPSVTLKDLAVDAIRASGADPDAVGPASRPVARLGSTSRDRDG